MIQPNFVTCCTGCSEACYGIDLPSSITATITDPYGTIPCLDGYSFEMVKTSFRGSGTVGAGTLLNANDFVLPVETGWAENLKIRSYFSYKHYSKAEQLQAWYLAQGSSYPVSSFYWSDDSLFQNSIPYWESISPDGYPYPPRNQANWQIGSCVGYAFDLDGNGNREYWPVYPSAFSRTTLGLSISVLSPYQTLNVPTYKVLVAEMRIQSPANPYNGIGSGSYRSMTIATFNINNYYSSSFQLNCDPFFMQFEMQMPEYFSLPLFPAGGYELLTYSTIGATKSDAISITLTE